MEEEKEYFTKFPNELLQSLQRTRISGTKFQIVLTIVRLTHGFGKDWEKIGYKRLMALTGLSKDTVAKSVQKLIRLGIVEKMELPSNKVSVLRVQPDYSLWEKYVPPPKSFKDVGVSNSAEYAKTSTEEYVNSHTEEYVKKHTLEKKQKGKEIMEEKNRKEGDSAPSNSKPASQQESISGLSKEELDAELVERLKEAWNRGKGEINPKVLRMEPGTLRFKKTVKAMRDHFFSKNYQEAIAMIKESDFASGRTGKWKADFDWLLREGNIDKVLEGNYKTLVKKDDDEGFIYGDDDIEIKYSLD